MKVSSMYAVIEENKHFFKAMGVNKLDIWMASEEAYKNGYKNGRHDFFNEVMNFLCDKCECDCDKTTYCYEREQLYKLLNTKED